MLTVSTVCPILAGCIAFRSVPSRLTASSTHASHRVTFLMLATVTTLVDAACTIRVGFATFVAFLAAKSSLTAVLTDACSRGTRLVVLTMAARVHAVRPVSVVRARLDAVFSRPTLATAMPAVSGLLVTPCPAPRVAPPLTEHPVQTFRTTCRLGLAEDRQFEKNDERADKYSNIA